MPKIDGCLMLISLRISISVNSITTVHDRNIVNSLIIVDVMLSDDPKVLLALILTR